MNVFDLHCDTATELYRRNLPFDNRETHVNAFSVKGHRVTQCFAVFFNDTKQNSDAMNVFHAVTEKVFPQLRNGGVTPILTVEGAGALAHDPRWIEKIHAAGCRMAGLSWNGKNPLATGAVTDDRARLSPLGRSAVRDLTSRGISVDVSHLSAAATEEILELTNAPVVASHSNAKAVCDHLRNLSDTVAAELFRRGGLVGLNLYPAFLTDRPTATLDDVLRHAEHFLTLGGDAGLALGCDLDGVDRLPDGMTDFSSLQVLYDRFCSGFGNCIADNIFYRNAERFFS
ncbi:MAG: membrane dipeptidase [Clostridia bacterium]|nr:membrane dipeptidase [Clostridia bacterium]